MFQTQDVTTNENSEKYFNNFNYWKCPLPDIEPDLAAFKISAPEELTTSMDVDPETTTIQSTEEEEAGFNMFNFWKPVLPDITQFNMDTNFSWA